MAHVRYIKLDFCAVDVDYLDNKTFLKRSSGH